MIEAAVGDPWTGRPVSFSQFNNKGSFETATIWPAPMPG